MTKRAIRRDEEASIRARAAKAIEASSVEVVGFYWNRLGSLRSIAVRSGPESERDITQHEIAALAAVGIHPGADGWEIEEAPAAVKVGDLFRSKKSGETWTVERWLTTDALWAIRCADGGTLYMTESDLLDPAQWTREAPANARAALPPGFGWYEHGHESYGLDVAAVNGSTIAKAHHDGYSWTWSIAPRHVRATARDLREAQERAEEACRAAGLFDAPPVEQAPTAPDLGAKVDAIHDAAGAPPTGAARTLMTLLLRATSLGEMPGTQPTLAERLDAMEHLCEAFVAELRASLPAAPMPAPRTTDGALTAYLLEHYRDAWRPGEDALALAIRLLGTQRHAIDMVGESLKEAREEARVTDESNAELAAELGKVRAALAREEARRIEAERGRGEALGDLATVRADVLKTAAELAAKMGAPHG